jgi:hypothetical protein
MGLKKKIILIVCFLLLTSILIGSANATDTNTTNTSSIKKTSAIVVWDYYPASQKGGKLEYMVYQDDNKDGRWEQDKEKLIQNIRTKTFNINKAGTYKVNLYYAGNDKYLSCSRNYTVKFTGNEEIDGWRTKKLYKTYKKYGHTYKKYKLYWVTQKLNGKTTTAFDGYDTIVSDKGKYKLYKTANEKIVLNGIPSLFFKNKLKIKAYYDGDNDIKLNYYFYNKKGKLSKLAGYIKIHKYYGYYSWTNNYKVIRFTSNLNKKLAIKYAKIVGW